MNCFLNALNDERRPRGPGGLLYTCGPDFEPVPEPDVLKWGAWFETADRHLSKTEVMECTVSTVFLGVRTCSNVLNVDGLDWMYETMVIGPENLLKHLTDLSPEDDSIFAKFLGSTDFQRRYRTAAGAGVGHEEIVALVRRALTARN